MNQDLDKLHPYPFEKLLKLFEGVTPNPDLETIRFSIGEPKHPAPEFVLNAIREHLPCAANYPTTKGLPELRQAIVDWLVQRFQLPEGSLNEADHVLPVTGTREALFAFTQVAVDRSQKPLVLMPNPFYQIYEGAALLAGAEPYYLPCLPETNFAPDFEAVPDDVWQRCQCLFICNPGNPTGAVLSREVLKKLIERAQQFNFVIASDECYSEIYFDEAEPPVGLLQVAAEMGLEDYANCVVFHSLSKRSNLPGLRSGFAAGDARIMQAFLRYRTYHGCAMPVQHQLASISAWQDEAHVKANRDQYRAKFDAVLERLSPVLNVSKPDAGFYLWPETPISDETVARDLYEQFNLVVLPGRYLGREQQGINPGCQRVRIALVASLQECIEGAERLQRYLAQLKA